MFKGQETRSASGWRLMGAFVVFALTVPICMVISASTQSDANNLRMIAMGWGLAVLVLVVGVPGVYRVGKCMICGSKVKLRSNAAGINCPGCKRRLVLRDRELHTF